MNYIARLRLLRQQRDERIKSMYEKGKSLPEIAKAVGVTKQRVHQILNPDGARQS